MALWRCGDPYYFQLFLQEVVVFIALIALALSTELFPVLFYQPVCLLSVWDMLIPSCEQGIVFLNNVNVNR